MLLSIQIIGFSMNGAYASVFNKYYIDASKLANAKALSDEILEALRPFVRDTRARILSNNPNFAYLSLGLKPTQIYPIYGGLSYLPSFIYSEYAKEKRANAFIPKDFIILAKKSYTTARDDNEKLIQEHYYKLLEGAFPYALIAVSRHFFFFANTDAAHSNITPITYTPIALPHATSHTNKE